MALVFSLIPLVLMLASAAPSWAQQDAQQRPSAPSGAIESITVTAEKHESDLQDMGISIQAFAAEDLERLSIQSTEDLGSLVPGMTFVQSTGSTGAMAISGRGLVHPENDPMRPETVAVYVDGVYVPYADATVFELIDLERIEFLKGPQGTLFGRNSTGGAVNIISKKPTSEFGGKIKVRLGEDRQRDVYGTLNFPIIGETLLGRVSGAKTRRDGYWTNNFAGNTFRFADDDGEAVRAALRWLPREDVTVDYAFEWYQSSEEQPLSITHTVYPVDDPLGRGFLPSLFLQPGQLQARDWRDPDQNHQVDRDVFNRRNTWTHSYAVAWEANEALTLKLLGGWRKNKFSNLIDIDGQDTALGEFANSQRFRSFNSELQVLGQVWDGRLRYVVGAMWYDEEVTAEQKSDLYRDSGFPLVNAAANDTDNYALGYFANVELSLTDKLEFTAGARYSTERREVVRDICNDVGPSGFIDISQCLSGDDGVANIFNRKFDARWDAWSPMFRLKYHWTDELMTYVRWSKGFSSGGFGPRVANITAAGEPFDPEFVFSWEVGIKSRWFGNRLQFNAAGFYDEVEDQQFITFAPARTGSVATIITNAAKSRIRGFEVDLRVVPLAGLTVSITHAWTHATFSEFITTDPATGLPINIADQRTFDHVPKRKWGGDIRYLFPAQTWGIVELGASFIRESEKPTLTQRVQRAVKTNKYAVYNARVALLDAFGVDGFSLALVGRNITDRVYRDGQGVDFGALGWATNRIGAPRRFFVEISYDFL